MIHQDNPQYIRVNLVSPEQIRTWAERKLPNGTTVGLVTKPYTLHYQTHKPEKDGLFCERIFGPIKDGTCFCGKYQSVTKTHLSNKFCEQCGVELTTSKMRRYRMGYIQLACKVTHVWFLRHRPSYIARLLNRPLRDIERLVYCDV